MTAICKGRREATNETKLANTLILDSSPPELWKKINFCFKATQYVIFCYICPSELIYCTSQFSLEPSIGPLATLAKAGASRHHRGAGTLRSTQCTCMKLSLQSVRCVRGQEE